MRHSRVTNIFATAAAAGIIIYAMAATHRDGYAEGYKGAMQDAGAKASAACDIVREMARKQEADILAESELGDAAAEYMIQTHLAGSHICGPLEGPHAPDKKSPMLKPWRW